MIINFPRSREIVRLPPRFKEALVLRDGVGCLAGLMKGDSIGSLLNCFELHSCTLLPSVSTFVKFYCWIFGLDFWIHRIRMHLLKQQKKFSPQRNSHLNRIKVKKKKKKSQKAKSYSSKGRCCVDCAMVFNAFCHIKRQCDNSRELHLIAVMWSVKWSWPLPTGVVKTETKQAPLFKVSIGV